MANVPISWADEELIFTFKEAASKWDYKKKIIIETLNIASITDVREDIAEVTIPEILAGEISAHDMMHSAATLQAFQTYRISYYDVLSDDHLEKLGKPTSLANYGEGYIKSLMEHYNSAIIIVTKELSNLGITDASLLAQEQFDTTIAYDKMRNKPITNITIQEAISINESLAGTHGKYITYLSGTSYEGIPWLSNAMHTLEDFMGIFHSDDLVNQKISIPLCVIQQQLGYIPKSPRILLEYRSTLQDIKTYISQALQKSKSDIPRTSTIIPLLTRTLEKFLIDFPERYY